MIRLVDVTLPRYAMFERVKVVTEVDSGVLEDFGCITGYLLNSPEFEPGWFYQVLHFELPHSPWIRCPFADLVIEADIRPIAEEGQKS